jgi:hypothetical protein
MTTQALSRTIHFRHELPLEELLRLLPQIAGSNGEAAQEQATARGDADQDFWTTFGFGCVQAAALFGLIYAYFAL